MKWIDLLNELQKMSCKRLNDDVTIHVFSTDEFLPARSMEIADEDCDVLDMGHRYLEVK